jgi:hypothetical protein
MRRCPNVITLDATVIGASGVTVPTDVSNSDLADAPRGYEFADIDAYELPSRSLKGDWVVKVVNDSDAAVDATPGITTADDETFVDYAEEGSTQTVQTGSPPGNVAHIHSDTVAGHLAAELVADPAPATGTVTVIFGSRLYGGA